MEGLLLMLFVWGALGYVLAWVFAIRWMKGEMRDD